MSHNVEKHELVRSQINGACQIRNRLGFLVPPR